MATTRQRRATKIDEIRNHVTQLLNAYEDLLGDASAWNNGVKNAVVDATGADLSAQGYQANDFAGHEGLMKADINQVLVGALATLKTFVESADGKKLEELRK